MLKLFRVFRLLQNLGTYGYRGLFERKKAFVESIPAALSQLDELLGNENGFPYLHAIIREIARLPMFVRQESKELTVDEKLNIIGNEYDIPIEEEMEEGLSLIAARFITPAVMNLTRN